MTTQTAVFDGLPTGLTLTGKVFDTDAPDTEVTGNSLAITEGANAKSRYAVVNTRATALPAGDYDIRLFVGSVPIAVGRFTFAGTDGETAVETAVTAVLDSAAINAVADQVWDEATSGHTTAGTYGGRIVRATNSNTEVQITGSNHIAADVHEFQAGVITAGDFAANSLTASALATDAVTEIQSGLATAAALAAAKTILDKVDTGLVIDGAVYQFTANMLELGPSGGGGGSGTGARTVTITVNDGTTVLQNAVVRFTEGSNTFRALTNASGVAVFNLDDATYTVAITKSGYTYAGTAMIVNGTETATYSMTAVSVTPGSGDLTTGYLTCLDELGAAEANVSVRCQLVQIPSSGTGFAYDSTVQVETSAANGLVEFPMVKGCRYLIWRGSIKPPAGIVPLLISASAGSTTALGSLIGD